MLGRWILLALLVPYVGWLAFDYHYHFIDGVNLLFHEAGHVFFGLLGTTLHFLGGTIGQLVFPILCAGQFLRQGQPFEASIMGVWLSESLMYAAAYIGDAQAQALPLVGGHVHDWNWLLSRWGLLPHCQLIAGVLHVLASLLAIGMLGLAARSLLDRSPQPTRV
jgi:hypothetical protein